MITFYGEIECAIHDPLTIRRGAGSLTDLDAAAEALAGAEFPVILAGGGVVAADGVAACVRLAEILGAPVANSYLHNDSFPASHELSCGPLGYHGSKAAMSLISKADVVLALGSRLGPFGTLPQYGFDYWPKEAKLVQIDADTNVLGLVKRADVTVCADAREAAEALALRLSEKTLAGSANRESRAATIQQERQAWREELNEWNHEKDDWSIEVAEDSNYMHPRPVLRELQKALPADAMVSTDIGNICQIANSYLSFDQPRSMFGAMMFGNCGYALPAMIGCKVAEPDRPAVAYVGDGAWGMSFGEILTCVREDIPVTAVVFNNQQWGAEKKNQVDFYSNRFLGVNLDNPSWAEVARSLGAEGRTIEKTSEVGPALADACRAALSKRERPPSLRSWSPESSATPSGVTRSSCRNACCRNTRTTRPISPPIGDITMTTADPKRHYWLPFTPNRAFRAHPQNFSRAEGIHYWSEAGHEILDACSGLFCTPLGHGRREKSQTPSMHNCSSSTSQEPLSGGIDRAFEAAERIARLTPAGLDHIFFGNSGSEAVETAIKMAFAYHRARGEGQRTLLVSRELAYHGVNLGGVGPLWHSSQPDPLWRNTGGRRPPYASYGHSEPIDSPRDSPRLEVELGRRPRTPLRDLRGREHCGSLRGTGGRVDRMPRSACRLSRANPGNLHGPRHPSWSSTRSSPGSDAWATPSRPRPLV